MGYCRGEGGTVEPNVKRSLDLPATASGRLDRALADALGLGRAAVKRAFQLGDVRVSGRRARASDDAVPGAAVEIDVEAPPGAPAPEPEAPLTVLLEHPRLIVVDKPAGVAVHPLVSGECGTLANAVVARYPECADASPHAREGGAVQRLDLETSGCVLFARDRGAWEEIHAALARRTVEKVYLALVLGRVEAGGVCSVPLAQRGTRAIPAPDELAEERLSSKGLRARPAETRWEVERHFERHTLLRVSIETGVTHQIRAHLAFLGHPVAGDILYGGEGAAMTGLSRQFLHAWRVALESPGGGGRLSAESPIPCALSDVLAAVG